MLSTARETPDQAEVARLLRLADQRAAALYPAESRHGLAVADLIAQDVRFFVARLASVAVGCGGFVLQAVEATAERERVAVMLLETGVGSVEARELYRRAGYRERGSFPPYGPDPLSVFLAKTLVP